MTHTESVHFKSNHRSPSSPLGTAGFVCGIIACALNLTVVLSVFGWIPGLLAVIFGIFKRSNEPRAFAGLLLGGISFLIMLIWVVSAAVPLLVDPTLKHVLWKHHF